MTSTSWFKQAIIYQIFIDRFLIGNPKSDKTPNDKKPNFSGGNIQGIIDQLDYIQDLGVNTIWLSPFNSTSAYHGYHITDFFDVDKHFGSLQILKKFINLAHSKNIKVIMDFVPNHVSHKHPYFLEAIKNKKSEYRNWFFFNKWPDNYVCFLKFKELPKLNLDYQPTRDHIIDSAKYWLDQGIDGIRLDHTIGPSFAFWKEFKEKIKSHKPSAVIIGETYFHGISFNDLNTINMKSKLLIYLKYYLGFNILDSVMHQYVNCFDGQLDFEFQRLLKEYIAKPKWYKPKWILNYKLKRHYKSFPKNHYLPTFLDNHDMNRFLFEADQDKNKLKKATKIQFNQKQPAIIYYGTEVGLSQKKDFKEIDSYSDLLARKMMSWENQDKDLLNYFKKLIKTKTK